MKIKIPASTVFNEDTNRFVKLPAEEFTIKHSLHTISLWEEQTHRPFIGDKKDKNDILEYIAIMARDTLKNKDSLLNISDVELAKVSAYILDSATATTFADKQVPSEGTATPKNVVLTSEQIYAMMISSGIPLECEHWHFNRLCVLIRLLNPEKSKGNTMTIADRNMLNAARKTKLNTKG